jgi:phenylalanyl-tRNA synthetase beta chain
MGLAAAADELNYVTSEHPTLRPGRTAQIERNGAVVGWLGELHPRLARKMGLGVAPVLFELQLQPALAAKVPEYRRVSRFPVVRRDLAVMVSEEISAAEIVAVAATAAGALLQETRVFDVYRGDSVEKGLKSVALGLILQETSRTLTEPEIDGVISSVIEGLSSKLNARIRE